MHKTYIKLGSFVYCALWAVLSDSFVDIGSGVQEINEFIF